jgi:hypothetical protein
MVVRYLRGWCSLAGGITGDRSGRPVILPNSKTQLQEQSVKEQKARVKAPVYTMEEIKRNLRRSCKRIHKISAIGG